MTPVQIVNKRSL